MPRPLATVAYAPVEITPHRDVYRLGRSGPPTPADWPERYLASLETQGFAWRAAKAAGVAYKTVERLRAVDPRFAEHERDAKREFVEGLEGKLDKLGDGDGMPAVTALIVRLKKEDQLGYVERNLTVTASFSAELDPAEGKQLLAAILSQAPAPSALPETT